MLPRHEFAQKLKEAADRYYRLGLMKENSRRVMAEFAFLPKSSGGGLYDEAYKAISDAMYHMTRDDESCRSVTMLVAFETAWHHYEQYHLTAQKATA